MVLSIEVDHNVWEFKPGETIRGKVVVNKHIWSKVEGLTISFHGNLETAAEEDGRTGGLFRRSFHRFRGGGSGATAITTTEPPADVGHRLDNDRFENAEEFLNQTLSLLEAGKVLKPGRHEFDFAFPLPPPGQLPQSMKIRGARVHYEVVTILKMPREEHKRYHTSFYILPVEAEYSTEQVLIAEFLSPTQLHLEREIAQVLGCCFTKSVTLDVQLERRVFPVGARLPFIVRINNGLWSTLEPVKVVLKRKFSLRKDLSYCMKETVADVTGPAVEKGAFQIWSTELHIPSNVPATNRVKRDVYEIEYSLHFSVMSSSYRTGRLNINIPIMILPPSVFSTLRINVDNDFFIRQSDESADLCPPPAYEEVMQGNSSDDEDGLLPTS